MSDSSQPTNSAESIPPYSESSNIPAPEPQAPQPTAPQSYPQNEQPYAQNTPPYIQNTPAYPPHMQVYPPNTQPYVYPPQPYPPNVQPYPVQYSPPVQQSPAPLQMYYVNPPPVAPVVQPPVVTVPVPSEQVIIEVPEEPSKTNSYILNTIVVVLFLASLTVLMSSFQWNPSENKTTETDPVTGESSTEISENTGATSFASAVIFIVWIAIAIMNLYVACSNRSCHCPLGFYYGSCCVLPTIIVIFFIYLLIDSPNTDAVWGVRVAFSAVMMIWGCVISCCIYVNRVTMTFIKTTTTYWSDGSKTKDTDRTDFGYVKCRNWGI